MPRFLAFALLSSLMTSACVGPDGNGSNRPTHGASVEPEARTVTFTTDVFTNAHTDVSPDGKTIVFDVIGNIYSVSIHGGKAVQLTQGDGWNTRPRFSPDGKRIAYISDAGGDAVVWEMNLDGSHARQHDDVRQYALTPSLTPRWSHDGFVLKTTKADAGLTISRKTGASDSEAYIRADGAGAEAMAQGAITSDGIALYFGGKGLHRQDLASGHVEKLRDGIVAKPQLSRDGSMLSYFLVRGDRREIMELEGGDVRCVLHAFDLRIGVHAEIPVVNRDCRRDSKGEGTFDIPDYALTPDGSAAVIAHEGRISYVDLKTGDVTPIPVSAVVDRALSPLPRHASRRGLDQDSIQARVIRWPTTASGAGHLVFSAFAKVFVHDLRTGQANMLTSSDGFENAPAISPDGNWVAYTTWSDLHQGHVIVEKIDGKERKQITREPGRYTNPAWSPNGESIAFIADTDSKTRMGLASSRSGASGRGDMQLHVASVSGGHPPRSLVEVGAIGSLMAPRVYPVPVFSADGARIVLASYVDRGPHQGKSVLMSVGVDGSAVRHHYQMSPVDEFVVSPRGDYAAVVWQNSLYLVSIDLEEEHSELPKLEIDADILVSDDGPLQVSWSGPSTLIWADANRIHRYQIGSAGPQLVADIDIRRSRSRPEGCLAYVGGRIITMAEVGTIEKGSVLVCGNRIVDVGKEGAIAIPPGTEIIDLAGTTIMPGLIETHAHPNSFEFEIESTQHHEHIPSLAYGVTAMYDPSSQLLVPFTQAELIDVGKAIGPRIYGAGTPIMVRPETMRGLGETPYEFLYRPIETAEGAGKVVRSLARYGAGPIKTYYVLSREYQRNLSLAARRHGVAITSHVAGYDHAMAGVIEGISIEHEVEGSAGVELYDDAARFLALSGVFYTKERYGDRVYETDVDRADEKLRRLVAPETLTKYADREPIGGLSNDLLIMQAKFAARIAELGGLVTLATHGDGIPGLAMHHELWALVLRGGMEPLEAVRAGTINGARKVGIDKDLGSIEKGKIADFIVMNANPLVDIRSSVDIRYVVKDGFVYDDETMTRIWPDHRELDAWPWQDEHERRELTPPAGIDLPARRQATPH